jgi:predicted Zn-dependent protease
MRYWYFLFGFILFNSTASAQAHVYDDLLILYVDEEYVKCMDKADRYINKDDTRRDALPYLYKSLCSHEMSKLDKYTSDPEFKYAARDALKYAAKYRKKDKESEYFKNYEDYWAELNTSAMETGFALFDEKAYSKAKRQFQRMTTYYPENPGAWQMLALAQLKMNLARDAAESMNGYRTAFAAVPDVQRLPKDQQRLLREGMIRYAEYLTSKGMQDSARATIAPGLVPFSENPEFKGLYDELN